MSEGVFNVGFVRGGGNGVGPRLVTAGELLGLFPVLGSVDGIYRRVRRGLLPCVRESEFSRIWFYPADVAARIESWKRNMKVPKGEPRVRGGFALPAHMRFSREDFEPGGRCALG